VLFYDKRLSHNNTISCSSCHQQAFAFGDPAVASTGVAGTTGRHSMRLVNSRFSAERKFFWDERAATLEARRVIRLLQTSSRA
jgi:cytochrome c peroxidase